VRELFECSQGFYRCSLDEIGLAAAYVPAACHGSSRSIF
jgi:hypothetical protein